MLTLEQRLESSPFLSRLIDRDKTTDSSCSPLITLQSVIDSLNVSLFNDLQAAELQLIDAKRRFVLAWCKAELDDLGSQHQRGELQTRFAEVSIQFALSLAWQRLATKQKHLIKPLQQNQFVLPGLFVFGMGKLGGRDLNFSSDVDLVAYFDANVLPVSEMLGKSYVCHQVLQELTKILSRAGAADFIWRVDWRLRPNASATSLAMSVTAAEDYYHFHASPWHRLALMKARVVAGDISLGQRFLKSLNSFIWRQNLDYRAVDELAEIKQRINLEHPGLRAQRQWQEAIGDNIDGFNVKLGSGGIREIEFFTNAQQLLWGGRYAELRTPNTVEALGILSEQKRINAEQALQLKGAYQFLRKVENAVQMLENRQTHLIPSDDGNKHALLALLNIDEWAILVAKINDYRYLVNGLFVELFAEHTHSDLGTLVWPEGLSQAADEVVEAWENGFQIYGVSNSVRHRLRPLVYALANYLNESEDHSGADVNEVVMRLHDFFKSLPQGEQYFRLLAESPVLLRSIVPPLLYSPPMTTLLRQSPHIIDCYVHGEWHYPDAFDSEYILQADDYGQQLERMRRFVNEHLYQLYQQFLRGQISPPTFQSALTALAEYTLDLAMQVVANEMGLREVPITVIGMGKIALRRMSPLSDLDLIFVYDSKHTTMELASRYVSRLQTAIASPMREGIVYELDTRLRPSGRSGAPTVSIESFAQHHEQRARTWEQIALMSSRIVAGRRDIESEFHRVKRDLIRRPRDKYQCQMDARKMWLRIIEHRVDDTPIASMNSKLRVGGLMQAEYLAACVTLDYGAKFSGPSVELDDLLVECLSYYGLEELPEIMQFWRIQQLWERLLGKTEQPLSSLRDKYFSRLLEHSSCSSMDELVTKKKRYAEFVVQGLESFFAETSLVSLAEMEEWQESPIKWQ